MLILCCSYSLIQHHQLLQEPTQGFKPAMLKPDGVRCAILRSTRSQFLVVLSSGHQLVAGTCFQTTAFSFLFVCFLQEFWFSSWASSYVLLRTMSFFGRHHEGTAIPSHGRISSLPLCTESSAIAFKHNLFKWKFEWKLH